MQELALGETPAQQAMDRGGRAARGLAHPLGSSARRRSEKDSRTHLAVDLDHEVDDGRLARSGTSGDDHRLFRHLLVFII